jgi:hypothetical protein
VAIVIAGPVAPVDGAVAGCSVRTRAVPTRRAVLSFHLHFVHTHNVRASPP